MIWWWGSGGGWVFGLITAIFWIALVVGAVLLLRNELPHLRWPEHRSPALRILEERYARGEVTREEFLERRTVLLAQSAGQPVGPPTPPPPVAPSPTPTSPTSSSPPTPESSASPPSAPAPDPDPEPKPNGEPPGPSLPPGAAESLWSTPGDAPDAGGDAGTDPDGPTQQLPSSS